MKKIILSLAAVAIITMSCNDNNAPKDQNEAAVSTTDDQTEIVVETTNADATKADAKGEVIKMTTDMFLTQIWDYKTDETTWKYKGDQPAIIDFYADWCAPCRKIAPIMDELAEEYQGKLTIYKVNVDNERELSGLLRIQSIPAILFIPAEGQPSMYTGAYPKEEYKKIINQLFENQI